MAERGMARKLVATRAELKQEKRDSAWVLNRVRRSLGTPDGRSVSVHAREVGAELDERQGRLDKIRAAFDYPTSAQWILDRVRAALVGDQPPAEEPTTGICATPCDTDCEADCHEYHRVPWKRDHEPQTCPGWRGAASERASHRAVKEADDAAGDRP